MFAWKDPIYRVPVKSWCPEIEENALEQINHLAQLPFVYKHVAIMPDCHSGYGMPIGGVIATEGVVIPNAVGVDIGCGMCAVKTSLYTSDIDSDILKEIMGMIRERIPVGFNHHNIEQDESFMPVYDIMPVLTQQYSSALKQLGTLGGGNHFIEIQADGDNSIWIMLHSGSRNLGFTVANYYNKLAVELNEKWFSSVPKSWELAFLPIKTEEAHDYMREMQYCVDFALANRLHMMRTIEDIFFTINSDVEFSDAINIAHNYARWENHFGKNVIVHRKGATSAKEGEIGIIPGSMGSNSYIVRGRGCNSSFNSCSHGAGRKMGRKEAKRQLDLSTEIGKMDDRGIIHGIRNVGDLDEAPGAYKDVDEVMKNQADLVEIVTKLRPLASIKG